MSIAMAAIVALICLKVTLKFLAPEASGWEEELSTYLFVYVSFLSVGYCAKKGNNMCVDILANKLFPGRWKRRILIAGEGLYVLLSLAFLTGVFEVTKEAFLTASLGKAIGVPLGAVYAGAVLGYCLGILRGVENLVKMCESKNE